MQYSSPFPILWEEISQAPAIRRQNRLPPSGIVDISETYQQVINTPDIDRQHRLRTYLICTIFANSQVRNETFIQFFLSNSTCNSGKVCYRADVLIYKKGNVKKRFFGKKCILRRF